MGQPIASESAFNRISDLSQGQARGVWFLRTAAALFCVHGIAHANRSAERPGRMAVVRGNHPRRHRGEARRQHADEPLDWYELDAVVLDRRADEHERIS